ncbi:MAG: hypothetical protein CBC59_002250 [Euryarchaeota archaeon TMED99]|nr:MAG: hypothetical protein CBC59_002250 [Euryarchaeota archaeon TMED99]
MDPKAPRIATASLVLGAITWILAVVSFTLNLGLEDGYGNEEVLLTVIGSIFFLISFLASRPREEMQMIETLSVEEQFAAIESLPTKFSGSSTQTDKFGFETPQTSTNSQAVIASILGKREQTDAEDISSAMAALSSGESGKLASKTAQSNPAPHAQTTQFREVFKASNTSKDSFERIKVENIPLPGMEEAKQSPDLPWQQPDREFQTSGIAHIPLPGESPKQPQTEVLVDDVPSMPDLDDLFHEATPSAVQVPSAPVLPNLDDLF